MAESDFFLVIEGVKGESADGKMKAKDAMDIESFQWGVSNQGSFSATGGGGSGRATFSDISFFKKADKASPSLALNCATGKHDKKATLYVRKAGGEQKDYYIIEMENCMVSSYSSSASNGSPDITESFTLNYSKIKWEYKAQDEDGAMIAGGEFSYDLKARETA